jgi:hypothetical protein
MNTPFERSKSMTKRSMLKSLKWQGQSLRSEVGLKLGLGLFFQHAMVG